MMLEFVMRFLDAKAKLIMEDPAAHLPSDHAFTRLQLRLLAREPLPPGLRDQAAAKVAFAHLEDYGVTACAPVLKEFSAVCKSTVIRRQVVRAFNAELRRFRNHELRVFRREGVDLNLHVFRPKNLTPSPRCGILFLFGGGWYNGKPEQFFDTGQHFARLGYVAMTADYRVKGRNNVPPAEDLKDTKAAIRYVRRHAGELGLDPGRLCVGGWSAGGHLAIAAAAISKFNHADDDLAISCRPDAVVMIAPGLDVATQDWFAYVNGGHANPLDLCPFRHIRQELPPTLTIVGDHDECIALKVVERFTRQMRRARVLCRLDVARGVRHHEHFTARTVRKIHHFLKNDAGLVR